MTEAREIGGEDRGEVGPYRLIRVSATLAMRADVHDAVLKWAALYLPNSREATAAQLVARAVFCAGAVFCQGLGETPEDDWPDATEVQIVG